MNDVLKLKRILETIATGEAPQTMLDDLTRVYGYDPRGMAKEGLSVLADIADRLPVPTA